MTHWREYLIEVAALSTFMVSAATMTVMLEHPQSPLRGVIADPMSRRMLMGIAMGLTAASIIYSPWGRRSGAHMNPAVTLTFFRLGKIDRRDAMAYVGAQFVGGVLGRVVLDTDVLVAAVRSDRGASRALLISALERRYPLLASVPLMLQYESVLTRPEHLTAAGISAGDVEVLFNAIALVVEPIRISYLWRPVLPDSGDDLVLETAVNGQADVVVTFNRHHFVPAAAAFGLEILAPGDAVRRLESRS